MILPGFAMPVMAMAAGGTATMIAENSGDNTGYFRDGGLGELLSQPIDGYVLSILMSQEANNRVFMAIDGDQRADSFILSLSLFVDGIEIAALPDATIAYQAPQDRTTFIWGPPPVVFINGVSYQVGFEAL
ncbi:hypothetical protein GCM10007989_07260 [Devosia pacifica]|uniref:Uncharacterized protein n=1 Tax=Devosia pacifica TaxID=1335967 RepID=A0A918VQ81_9HYPH|nr:hypothetical protein [Devosia pacifica]GHA15056.1 hypothetical protein GCM10007989_07260 [Devosia pacifica]